MNSRGRRCGGGSLLAVTNLMKRAMWGDHLTLPYEINRSQSTSQLVTIRKIQKSRRYQVLLVGSFLAGVLLYLGADYMGGSRRRVRRDIKQKMTKTETVKSIITKSGEDSKDPVPNELKKVSCAVELGPLKYIGLDGLAEAAQLKYFLVDDGNSDTEIIKDVLLVMDEQSNELKDC